MKQFFTTGLVRAFCVLLCVLLVLPVFPAAAQSTYDLGYLTFEVTYTDAQGVSQTAYPIPVSYAGYEGSYWVNVPQEAMTNGLTLVLEDTIGQFKAFSPASGTVIYPSEAGSTLTESLPFDIMCMDANGQVVYMLHLYVSTVAAEPEAPQETQAPVVSPQVVTVYFRTLDNGSVMDVASSKSVTVDPGTQPVYADPDDLLDGYELTGDSVQYVTVDETGANPFELTFYYTYKATPAPVTPVDVPVHYYDSSYQPVADDATATCSEGVTDVRAEPVNLKDGYRLIGSDIQQVTVDANGANPAEIIFFYEYVQTAAPTVNPVDVTIHYLDETSHMPVAQDTYFTCAEGDTDVYPAPNDLLSDYELSATAPVKVTVTAQGADPAEVTFYYRYVKKATATPEAVTSAPEQTNAPAPKVALIAVNYYRQGEAQPFFTDTVMYATGTGYVIEVQKDKIPDGYQIVGDDFAVVDVNENGEATPSFVSFIFEPVNSGVIRRDVTVLYQTKDGVTVATSTTQQCSVGLNTVYAAPKDLKDGYDLIDSMPQTVTLQEDGTLSAQQVIFYYQKSTEKTPDPNEEPANTTPPADVEIEPATGYAYPRTDDVNFRSSPSTAEDNIIGKVGKSDLLTILGTTKNSSNESWYYISFNGQTGFIKASFTHELTQEEINAVMGYTAQPTTQPTLQPTPVPDGSVIDLWGEISSKSVNFRSSQKASSSNKIKSLSRGTKVWVYDVETVDNTRWYTVRVNGKDGYIVADYVTLYSKDESDAYQATLPTPMPTQTPEPTKVPTATPTMTPTPSPTAIATSTPTRAPDITVSPVPYIGYGLTTSRASVRSGISWGDETILETIEQNTLVLISAQTYVSDVCWDSVSVLASGTTGFMEDARLRRITNEEAKYYLDLLAPTATPTALPTPEPFSGYARSLGNNVPLRSFMDTNAQILAILNADSVVSVYSQQTLDGETWCLVQYGEYYGYVRRDMITQMNDWEIQGYLSSLKTPTPTPAPTPTAAPITGDSLSSYGYVSKNKVNLRKDASVNSTALRLMSQYDFALVLGTISNAEGTWYHILQNGIEGYVLSNYFRPLSINELSNFLTSDEYLGSAGNTSSGGNGASGSNNIQSIEDYNQGVWQNPALSASYEPFNPYATATPNPNDIVTATPSPSPSPTASLVPLVEPTQAPNSTGSTFPVGLVAFIILLIAGGGGIYAYTIHRRNERRRAALRAQQARRAQQASMGGQPMMRAPGAPERQQTRSYPAGANYMPQSGAAPRPANSQYQAGSASQATQRYNPQTMSNPYAQRGTEPTANYRPLTQDTGTYRRPESGAQNGAYNVKPSAQQPGQGTNPYQNPAARNQTRPAYQNQETPNMNEDDPFYKTESDQAQNNQTRRRRSERFHHDENDGGNA